MKIKRNLSITLTIAMLATLLLIFNVAALDGEPAISGLTEAKRNEDNITFSFTLTDAPMEGLTASLIAVVKTGETDVAPSAEDLLDPIYLQEYTLENGEHTITFPVDSIRLADDESLRVFLTAEGVSEYVDYEPESEPPEQPRLDLAPGQAPSFVIRKNMITQIKLDTNCEHLSFTSSNPNIVTVTQTGVVTGKSIGVAVVQIKDLDFGLVFNIVVNCTN